MALHGDDHAVLGLHRFDDAVGAVAVGRSPGASASMAWWWRLLTISCRGATRPSSECRIDLDGMGQRVARLAVELVTFDVLEERAAQGDVDDLLAAADAQHGTPDAGGGVHQLDLGLVEGGVDSVRSSTGCPP